MRLPRWVAFGAAVLIAGCGDDGTGGGSGGSGPLSVSSPTIEDGFDWTLPAEVTPDPYSGWFLQGTTSDHLDIRHMGRTYYWADLNPSQGAYDLSSWREHLSTATAEGRGLIARLKCSVTWRDSPWGDPGPFVPQWVLDVCQPAEFHTDTDIRVAAPWDPCVQQHYQTFVAQVGAEGILADAALVGLYVHGISSSFGEEMWLTDTARSAAEAAGMNQQVLEQAFTDRLGWWAAAAAEDAYKLAWVWGGIGYEYRDTSEAITAYAIARGIGLRGGGLELYHDFRPPEAGQTLDGDGHITTDWTWPVRAEGRYLGDEIEIYDSVEESLRPILFGSSIVRAVQLGMNFLWTAEEAPTWNGDLVHWYTLVAGKLPSEAPNAVCWLREGYVEHQGGDATLRNFEHLLVQRDVEGGRSVAVDRVDRPAMWMDPDDIHFDYMSRSTDVAADQRVLAFFVDPSFMGAHAGELTIKVSYLDDSDAQWALEASGAGGAIAASPVVLGTGDGNWRTATFSLSGPPEAGAWPDGEDFRLRLLAGGDLTVRFVRVVR